MSEMKFLKLIMRLIFFLIKELKEWLEFFIRNIPGRSGYFVRSHYYKLTYYFEIVVVILLRVVLEKLAYKLLSFSCSRFIKRSTIIEH